MVKPELRSGAGLEREAVLRFGRPPPAMDPGGLAGSWDPPPSLPDQHSAEPVKVLEQRQSRNKQSSLDDIEVLMPETR